MEERQDLISRQVAIDALHMHLMYRMGTDSNKKRLDDWINGVPSVQPERVCVATVTLTDEQVKEAVEKAKNAVISVIEPEPHWIPCSERLPEKNCRCLTTNEAWGSFEVDWNAWIDGQWLYPNEKPIAWMSLPEPYRGGEKE